MSPWTRSSLALSLSLASDHLVAAWDTAEQLCVEWKGQQCSVTLVPWKPLRTPEPKDSYGVSIKPY